MRSISNLELVREEYPGRVVLYPEEIGGLLGKTASAMAGLIERGQLPFKVKMLSGRRCVALLDIVDWLDSGGEIGSSVTLSTTAPETAPKPSANRKSPRSKSTEAIKAEKPKRVKIYEPIAGGGPYSLAKKLAEMRAMGWCSKSDLENGPAGFLAESFKCFLMQGFQLDLEPPDGGRIELWDFDDEGISLGPVCRLYEDMSKSVIETVLADLQKNVAIDRRRTPISVVRAIHDGELLHESIRLGSDWVHIVG